MTNASDPKAMPNACASGASSAGLGLVSSSTSDKTPPDLLKIDAFQSRYRRLRKNVLTSERLIRQSAADAGFRHLLVMVTLTYAPGSEWAPHHISAYQKNVRAWMNARGHKYSYVWVCELQRRGAPHYHVLVWLPRGLRLPKADLKGWWPHGMTNTQQVRHGGGYLAKYLSKVGTEIHRFRKGQRTHGSGGLDAPSKLERRWWLAPGYVREKWDAPTYDVRPAAGGGWFSRLTGELLPSPWKLVGFSPSHVIVRRIEQRAQPNQSPGNLSLEHL
jgi:hypothetical protein